jgi:hypothetical protein
VGGTNLLKRSLLDGVATGIPIGRCKIMIIGSRGVKVIVGNGGAVAIKVVVIVVLIVVILIVIQVRCRVIVCLV